MKLSDLVADGWGALMPPVATPMANADTQETRWRGASRMLRSLSSWEAIVGSPLTDLPASEQKTMRARSRDAFRSHLIGRAALTRSRTNIVGTGLMARCDVDGKRLGLTPEETEAINAQIRSEWELYFEDPHECDYEATLDGYGQQGLALLSAMLSGDVFGVTPYEKRPGCRYGLKMQLVEADRCSNPHGAIDTRELTDGVQTNAGGYPLGYWISDTHPGEAVFHGAPGWTFYPAFDAITGRRRTLHVWNDKERPSQRRGAPYLAPILEPLMQITRYGGAELMAAVVSAMLTVFIERESEDLDENGNPITSVSASAAADASQSPVPISQPELKLGNAAILDLAPGEKANQVNPARPNANFDPFFAAVVKQIGAALEIPLDELMLHYQASYSAARAAMLQAWRFYTQRRWNFVVQFCQPWYCLWMDEAVAAGYLSLPGYGDPVRRRAYQRCLWIGPARGSMDEEKEAKAVALRIEAGISNESIETAAATGESWHTVYAQRVREIQQRRRDNMLFEKKPQPAPQPEPPAPPPSGA